MEMMDIYDENRIPLGRQRERHSPMVPGEYRLVIHVVVFDSRGRMLIQRRTHLKEAWPGRWDVTIGGGVDAGETSRQGAEREFREELGYPLSLAGEIPYVSVNFPGGFDDYYLVNLDLPLEELRLQREEVAEVRWAEEEDVVSMIRSERFIPYPEHFIRYLFETRTTLGFPTR